MKIDKDKLLNFVKLISLKGEIEITEAIFDFKENEIICLANKNGIVVIKALLKYDGEELGELGIDNLKFLKDGVKLFNEEQIEIKLDKNKLILKSDSKKLTMKLNLRNCQYILTKVTNAEPTVHDIATGELDKDGNLASNREVSKNNKLDIFTKLLEESKTNPFTLSEESKEKIIKHYNSIKSEEVILEGKDNELIIRLENNENELIDSFEIEQVEKFKIKVSKFFIGLLSILDGEVKMSIVDGKFIYVVVDEEDCFIEYLIAPRK